MEVVEKASRHQGIEEKQMKRSVNERE